MKKSTSSPILFQICSEAKQEKCTSRLYLKIYFRPPCDNCVHCGEGDNSISDCKARVFKNIFFFLFFTLSRKLNINTIGTKITETMP